MFQKHSDNGYIVALEGVRRKTLAHGEKTLMSEFLLEKGSRIPRHAHPHEQTGYLLKGEIRLFIGPDEITVGPGDAWCVPGDVEHGVEVLEDSVVMEVFSPVREDYLP
jgi:quercetin dioxygenase-like cupin family protein